MSNAAFEVLSSAFETISQKIFLADMTAAGHHTYEISEFFSDWAEIDAEYDTETLDDYIRSPDDIIASELIVGATAFVAFPYAVAVGEVWLT
jgi:hypothetical protein